MNSCARVGGRTVRTWLLSRMFSIVWLITFSFVFSRLGLEDCVN